MKELIRKDGSINAKNMFEQICDMSDFMKDNKFKIGHTYTLSGAVTLDRTSVMFEDIEVLAVAVLYEGSAFFQITAAGQDKLNADHPDMHPHVAELLWDDLEGFLGFSWDRDDTDSIHDLTITEKEEQYSSFDDVKDEFKKRKLARKLARDLTNQ
jgi:hypothetical protein